MGWRIIKQPNGLLARFSDVVDDFTDANLSVEEAIDLCRSEHGMSDIDARRKVQGGVEDWLPGHYEIKGSGHDRWEDALETIGFRHGKSSAQIEREMGINQEEQP